MKHRFLLRMIGLASVTAHGAWVADGVTLILTPTVTEVTPGGAFEVTVRATGLLRKTRQAISRA